MPNCQQKVQGGFERAFGWWADAVSKRTTIFFIVSLVIFIACSLGMSKSATYEDEQLVWTPAGNPSIVNYQKSKDLFNNDEKARPIGIIAVAKGDNLLTRAAFLEMIELEKRMNAVTEWSDTKKDRGDDTIERPKQGTEMSLIDVCDVQYITLSNSQQVPKCRSRGQPIDFVWTANKGYDMTGVTDAEVLRRVNSGRNSALGAETFFLKTFLAATDPEEFDQSFQTGAVTPQVTKAKAASYGYFIKNGRNPDVDESMYAVMEEKIFDELSALNDENEHVRFELFTTAGLRAAFSEDIRADLILINIAILLVAFYTIFMLGTCSGMHCRLVVTLMGLVCVGLAYASGFGLVYLMGGQTAGVHSLMPFLLIGIGVDDMFVICNAVDQQDLNLPASERIRKAMQHAGPSITITSLTNSLAFAFGGINSLTALRSFCLFAAMCILMLYLIVMTVFLCVVVWDTERVGRKKGECCGLCMCGMNNPMCCRGFFLSGKQKRYGDLNVPDGEVEKVQNVAAIDNSQDSSKTEKFIDTFLAPKLLSNVGRIVLLVIYLVLIGGSVYGCLNVKIDFKVTFFIGETAAVYGYFQENDRYFATGSFTTFYVDNADLDYTSTAVQKEIQAFNTALVNCPECEEQWYITGTLSSWYENFNSWAKRGGCAPLTPASSAADYTIPANRFNVCLDRFLKSDAGRRFGQDLIYDGTLGQSDFKLKAFRQKIQVKKIDEVAKQGVKYLEDTRRIEAEHAPVGTYSYAQEMLDYELYVVFEDETALSVGLSIVAVFFVVLFVTASLPVTGLVCLAVLLVDYFLLALIHYWDLTFNNVVVINIVIAIGLAVDYSAHISHTYLIIEPPAEMTTNSEKRKYKAHKALSSMGSSVFHGGFSTFLAIIALAGSRSYIFVVFFRLWFGIIVFGMANGFLLLPVILSYVGPLNPASEDEKKIDGKAVGDKDIEMAKQQKSPEPHGTESKANLVA